MKKIVQILSAVLVSIAATAPAATIEMDVNGLVCAFCAQGIEKKLRAFEATDDLVVSLEQRLVAVSTKPGQDIGDDVLRTTLTDAGYTVKAIRRSDEPLAAVRERLRAQKK